MTTQNALVFYVDPRWRRGTAHTPLLNPWWGNPLSESSLYTKRLFDTYSFDSTQYAITADVRAADIVLLPYAHGWCVQRDPALYDECVRTAQRSGLPLLIDGTGDIEYPVPKERTYVLRYGGYRFLPEPGRIQIPLMADDLLERYHKGRLDLRHKTGAAPVVGFAGWASLTPTQRLRTVLKELPLRTRGLFDERYQACVKGVLWREKALRVLTQSTAVTIQGHTRSSFSGTAKTAERDMQTLQRQMVDTILQSDYALDVRGDANNSARLFEILSLGRIPVILDTERNFPFSDYVDYTSFALMVDFRNIHRLPEEIAAFHASLSPERFEQMQRNARAAYVQHFRIDAMTRPIMEQLRALMAADATARTGQ